MKGFTHYIIYFVAVIWLLVCIGVGFGFLFDAPYQTKKDRDFIKYQIDPNITTIDSFRSVNGRLPSVAEFERIKNNSTGNYGNQSYIREPKFVDAEIKDKVKDLDWNNNYVLAVWRGEWWEYYISRNHVYVTNNYKPVDGWIGKLIFFIIGVIPLTGLIFRHTRIRQISHSS
ncbi:hypothetical protein AAFN85_15805 [Mucilaginibacter sp. CAU 1740]|uniref:hypothetical protein n=1 Tax=Mucilaginibacter sp. CAU 1740 TaxID=3140365 RepID=UPI00325C275C